MLKVLGFKVYGKLKKNKRHFKRLCREYGETVINPGLGHSGKLGWHGEEGKDPGTVVSCSKLSFLKG